MLESPPHALQPGGQGACLLVPIGCPPQNHVPTAHDTTPPSKRFIHSPPEGHGLPSLCKKGSRLSKQVRRFLQGIVFWRLEL